MNVKYRPDIDGLRAVAVMSVIAYHTNIPGFSGGFVGVDIFFVISGFLITSVILKEINAGDFTVAQFYERRVRRIFPALFPVIFFTLAAGALFFEYRDFKDLGQGVAATTLFSSNILFWKRSGYFDASSLQNPLLHTWSLAVEEQFYIFFPLFLLLIAKFSKKKYLPWLAGVGLLSLATSSVGAYLNQGATFYLMPTRAWELGAGAILALGLMPAIKRLWIQNAISFMGVVLIAYGIFFYTDSTRFPGLGAIPPVLGAFLLIYSGYSGGSIFNRLLSLKPMVYTGLISYSLYLWHWPIIVFSRYMAFPRSLGPFEVSLIILATFLVSGLSLRFIERPFRGSHGLIQPRRRLFALSASIMIVTSILGAAVYIRNGLPSRYPQANAAVMKAYDKAWWDGIERDQASTARLGESGSPPRIGARDRLPEFILWGDSHAQALIPVLDEMAAKEGVAGFVTAIGGRPPILGFERTDVRVDSLRINDGIFSFIRAHPELRTVIVACYWNLYVGHLKPGKEARSAYPTDMAILKTGLENTVGSLLALGRKVVLVSDVPNVGFDVPKDRFFAIARPGEYRSPPRPTIEEHRRRNDSVDAILRELSRLPNVSLVAPDIWLFDKSGRVMTSVDDELLYRDATHLSKYGAFLVRPAFAGLFKSRMGLP